VHLAWNAVLRFHRAMLWRRRVVPIGSAGEPPNGLAPVLLLFGVNISLLFHSVTLWLIILSLAS
jgi:hypothetical protein